MLVRRCCMQLLRRKRRRREGRGDKIPPASWGLMSVGFRVYVYPSVVCVNSQEIRCALLRLAFLNFRLHPCLGDPCLPSISQSIPRAPLRLALSSSLFLSFSLSTSPSLCLSLRHSLGVSEQEERRPGVLCQDQNGVQTAVLISFTRMLVTCRSES